MKKLASSLTIAVLAGVITLGSYKFFIEKEQTTRIEAATPIAAPAFVQATYNPNSAVDDGVDFTVAAEKTLNGVVHVKNMQEYIRPRNMMEAMRGTGERGQGIVGAGSGVIISADGYIVTNNHVIAGATDIEVSLNDNRTYTAEIIGRDEKADIALLKINGNKDFPYITFGDSDAAKVGEWVLAVGNPFNLTSTVTAGIISAKARDINEYDLNYQSFIQTDAAINPGNSGGALVNTKGELIGINTAITSKTGSYVGYAFAVPSNNARKIVNDLLEFGAVQKGILGVQGGPVTPRLNKEYDLGTSEGFYVAGVELESGAQKAGIQKGDVITMIDNIKISKFSDLTGYVNTKQPDDVVNVSVLRNNREIILPVKLFKSPTYELSKLGVEVKNATDNDLKRFGANQGVVISRLINPELKRASYQQLVGAIIAEIDQTKVSNVDDVSQVMKTRDPNEPISIVVIINGERNRFIFED